MLHEFVVLDAKIYPKSSTAKWDRMRSWILPLLTFNFSLLILQCGLDVEDPTLPSPPVWIQKSLPEEWPERGIDAHESGGIYLEWAQSPEDNIAAYLLFRTMIFHEYDSLSDYELLYQLETETEQVLEYLDNDVAAGPKYQYRLRAQNLAGNLGPVSESVSYTLLPAWTIGEMTPNGALDTLGGDRKLKWSFNYHVEMENYCLTILTADNRLVWREILIPQNYIGENEFWRISQSMILESEQSYKWRMDTGGKYSYGLETTGSESNWATFLYIQG
jgi:hypothetical protein